MYERTVFDKRKEIRKDGNGETTIKESETEKNIQAKVSMKQFSISPDGNREHLMQTFARLQRH